MSQAIRRTKQTIIMRKLLDVDIGPFLVVMLGAVAGSVKFPTAADQNFIGVTLEDGKAGEFRDIAMDGGIVPMTASAAIAEGAWVSIAGTSGKIKTAAPSAGSNAFVLGRAVEAAAADGDRIGVLFTPSILQG